MTPSLPYDINPLEPIIDHSFEVLSLVCVIGIITLVGAIFLFRFYIHRFKTPPLSPWQHHLRTLDTTHPKECAYTLTKWGAKGVDSEEKQKLYNDLLVALEPYKYKKNVPPFDERTHLLITMFIHEVCDV